MLRQLLSDELRLLTFRRPSSALATHWQIYLIFGLACTWLAGIGRYWDNPRAHLLQHLGLGSVIYVFFLALLLWALLYPLRPQRWSFRNVLVFVTLTAPPALLYALPVERFMSLDTAQATNAWFLGVVATWRVALLVLFLRRVAALSWFAVLVATLLPLTLIVVALSGLNLEHVVFSLMSGIQPENRSPSDISYSVVFLLSIFSIIAAPVVLIAYAALLYVAWRHGNDVTHPG